MLNFLLISNTSINLKNDYTTCKNVSNQIQNINKKLHYFIILNIIQQRFNIIIYSHIKISIFQENTIEIKTGYYYCKIFLNKHSEAIPEYKKKLDIS